MTINDRISTAVNSSNLKHRDERIVDVDVVGALAYAGGLGSLLHRIKDGGQLYTAKEAVVFIANRIKGIAYKRRWKINKAQTILMAELVLDEWVNDRCNSCNGVGKHLLKWYEHDIEKTRDEVCSCCGGTGQKTFYWRDRCEYLGAEPTDDWRERFREVHQFLHTEYDRVAKSVRHQTRRDEA